MDGARWLHLEEKRIARFVRETAHFLCCVEGADLAPRRLVYEAPQSTSPLGRSAEG